ncbi:B3 domain-containing transcription factor VRN1-like [Melia azedarach]|uniref:B3 domain-containing transcription factor VRN1-like n=1 Tax=Melia azedarach TaxID=155640 RepID=A0ACC1XY23_MELAZ|nr:B3 domain-containing transcription factor VRN1-like [Melia azedarach]
MSNPLVPTSSHFFKVILPSTLEDKKLRIPAKFVKKFGDELSAVATLRVPNGCVWRVGLKKDGRKIWFHENWDEFVKYHSICFGYFLVFKYVKNSTFHVLIFDTTACQIDYQSNQNDKQNSAQEDEKANEKSVEILDSTATYKRPISPEKKREPESKKCKLEETEEMDELNGVNDDDDELVALLKEKGICITGRHYLFSTEERERAIEIARLVEPKHPSFMIILGANSRKHTRVYAPAAFGKYVNRSLQFVKLQNACGRERRIKIHKKSSNSDGFHFRKGWGEFSKNNDIHGGDICVFELIRTEDVLLKVSVFHQL